MSAPVSGTVTRTDVAPSMTWLFVRISAASGEDDAGALRAVAMPEIRVDENDAGAHGARRLPVHRHECDRRGGQHDRVGVHE